ncbi:MAG TPA: hypothetical protein VFY14_10315, partial [Streptomyces sp.]|nr:hypothetical protein [Streptomyces sp.]
MATNLASRRAPGPGNHPGNHPRHHPRHHPTTTQAPQPARRKCRVARTSAVAYVARPVGVV